MRKQLRNWMITIAAAALATAAAAQTGKPKLIPNSVKYRDSGRHAVSKRAGLALLTGRALVNKDLSVDVELTTPAPGNIAKVQLKPLDNTGKATFVTNWSGLSGSYFHQNVTGIGRNQTLQIQANLTGFDSGTDVFTLNLVPALRPDLMVSDIRPASGKANVPLSIFATVQELNGDTGANANCVLYINNTASDEASAIWVDAGGTVSCMFLHTFTAVGNYELKVAAENTLPADFDTSNNSATATITITSPTIPLDYKADATDQQINKTMQFIQAVYNGDQLETFQSMQQTQTGWSQASDLTVSKSLLLSFPIGANVTESSNGSSTDGSVTSLSGNFAIAAPDNWSAPSPCAPPLPATSACTQSRTFYADGWFTLQLNLTNISDSIAGNSGNFSIEVSRNAGDVTFLSTSAFCSFSDPPEGTCPANAVYFTNASPDAFGGPRIAFGTQDVFHFAMSDAAGTQYSADVVIPLTSSGNSSNAPAESTCAGFVPSPASPSCSGSVDNSVTKQGAVPSPQR